MGPMGFFKCVIYLYAPIYVVEINLIFLGRDLAGLPSCDRVDINIVVGAIVW